LYKFWKTGLYLGGFRVVGHKGGLIAPACMLKEALIPLTNPFGFHSQDLEMEVSDKFNHTMISTIRYRPFNIILN
jgi:hypothetical protein